MAAQNRDTERLYPPGKLSFHFAVWSTLLLLVMVADHHISETELDEIRKISEDSGWESDTFSFDQYFGQAMAAVRSAISNHAVEALLDSIDARVTSSVLRASLFSAARDVANIDADVDLEESLILGQLAARFG